MKITIGPLSRLFKDPRTIKFISWTSPLKHEKVLNFLFK